MQVISSSADDQLEDKLPPQSMVDEFPDNTVFAYTRHGRATQRTLDQWLAMVKRVVFGGDVADEPGKRVVIKMDESMGLRYNAVDWIKRKRREGFIIYPNLCDGEAVNRVRCNCSHYRF